MDDLLPFLLAAVALTGTPGPTNLALAATGAGFGARRASGLVAGALLGMAAIMSMVGSGVTGLLLALPGVAPLLVLLASGYLLYLAWRIGTAPPPGAGGAMARPPSIPGGLAITLGNPKAYVAMSALFSGYALAPGRPLPDLALKVSLLLPLILLVQVLWLLLGASLARLRGRPGWHRALNLGFAGALVLSVGLALLL